MESLRMPSSFCTGEVDLRYLLISRDLSTGGQLRPSREEREGRYDVMTMCFPDKHVDRMSTSTSVSELLKTHEHLETSGNFRHALVVILPGGVIYAYVLPFLSKAYLLKPSVIYGDAEVDFDPKTDMRTFNFEGATRSLEQVTLADLGLKAGVVGLIGEWNAGSPVDMPWHPQTHEVKNPICCAVGLSRKVKVPTHSFFMTDGAHSKNVWPHTFSRPCDASTHILASSEGAQPVYYPPEHGDVDWRTCRTYAVIALPTAFKQAIQVLADHHPLVAHTSSSLYFNTLLRCEATRIPQLLQNGLGIVVSGTLRNGTYRPGRVEIPFVTEVGLKVEDRGFKTLVCCLYPATGNKVETHSYMIDSEGVVISDKSDVKEVSMPGKRFIGLCKTDKTTGIPPQALEGRFYLLDDKGDVVKLVQAAKPGPSVMQVAPTMDQKVAPTMDQSVFEFDGTPHARANKFDFSVPQPGKPKKQQSFVEFKDSDSEDDSGHAPGVGARSGKAADGARGAEARTAKAAVGARGAEARTAKAAIDAREAGTSGDKTAVGACDAGASGDKAAVGAREAGASGHKAAVGARDAGASGGKAAVGALDAGASGDKAAVGAREAGASGDKAAFGAGDAAVSVPEAEASRGKDGASTGAAEASAEEATVGVREAEASGGKAAVTADAEDDTMDIDDVGGANVGARADKTVVGADSYVASVREAGAADDTGVPKAGGAKTAREAAGCGVGNFKSADQSRDQTSVRADVEDDSMNVDDVKGASVENSGREAEAAGEDSAVVGVREAVVVVGKAAVDAGVNDRSAFNFKGAAPPRDQASVRAHSEDNVMDVDNAEDSNVGVGAVVDSPHSALKSIGIVDEESDDEAAAPAEAPKPRKRKSKLNRSSMEQEADSEAAPAEAPKLRKRKSKLNRSSMEQEADSEAAPAEAPKLRKRKSKLNRSSMEQEADSEAAPAEAPKLRKRKSVEVERETDSDDDSGAASGARRTRSNRYAFSRAGNETPVSRELTGTKTKRPQGGNVWRQRSPPSRVNTETPLAESGETWPRGMYGRDHVLFVLTAKRKNKRLENGKDASEVDARGLPGFEKDGKVRAYSFDAKRCATLRSLCTCIWMDLYASFESHSKRRDNMGGNPRLRIYYERDAATKVRFIEVVFFGYTGKEKSIYRVKLHESTWTPQGGFSTRPVDELLDHPLGEIITPSATLVWDVWPQKDKREFVSKSFEPTDDMVDASDYPLNPSAAYIGGGSVPIIDESRLARMPEREQVDQTKWNKETASKLIEELRNDLSARLTPRTKKAFAGKRSAQFLRAVMGDAYRDTTATEDFVVNVFIELWDWFTITVKRKLYDLVQTKDENVVLKKCQEARKKFDPAPGKKDTKEDMVERLHNLSYDEYLYNICLVIRLPIVLGAGLKAHDGPLSISSYGLKQAAMKLWGIGKSIEAVFNGLEPVITKKNKDDKDMYTALRAQDVAQKMFNDLAGEEGIKSTLEGYHSALEESDDVMETLDIMHGLLRFTAARREHHLLARGAVTSRLEVLRSVIQRLNTIQARVILNVGPSGAGKTASCAADSALASQCQSAVPGEDTCRMLEHGALVERLAPLFKKLDLKDVRVDAAVSEVERRVQAYMDDLESQREVAIDAQLQEESVPDERLTQASAFSGIAASGFVGMTTSLFNVRTEPLGKDQPPRLFLTLQLQDSEEIVEVLLSGMGEKARRFLLKVLSEILQPKPNQDHGPFTGMDTRKIDAVTQYLPGRCWTTVDAPGWNDNDPRAEQRTNDALRTTCIMTRVFMRTTDNVTTSTLNKVNLQHTTAVAVCNTVDKQPKRSLYQLAWGTDMVQTSNRFRETISTTKECLFRTNSSVGIPAYLECGDLLRRSDRLVKLPACLAATQSSLEADHRDTVFVRALCDLFDELAENLSLQAPDLVGDNTFFTKVSDLLVNDSDVGNRLVQRLWGLPSHESLQECIDMKWVQTRARLAYYKLLEATNRIINPDAPLDLASDGFDAKMIDAIFDVVNGRTTQSSSKREHIEAELMKFIDMLCNFIFKDTTLGKYIESLRHRRDSVRESVLVSIKESLERSKEGLRLELSPNTANEIVTVKRTDGGTVVGAEFETVVEGWRHVANRVSELVDRVYIAAVDLRSAAQAFDNKCLKDSLRLVLLMIVKAGSEKGKALDVVTEFKRDSDMALERILNDAIRCLDKALMKCPQTVCSCLLSVGVRDTSPCVNNLYTRTMKLFVDKAQTQLIADKIQATLRECKEASVKDLVDFGRTLTSTLSLGLAPDVDRLTSMGVGFWKEQSLQFRCEIHDDVPQQPLVEVTPTVDLSQWFKDQTGHDVTIVAMESLDELMTAAMNHGISQAGWWTSVVDSVLAMMGTHLFTCFGGPNQRPYLTASNLLGPKKELLPCFAHDVTIWEHIVELHNHARGGQGQSFHKRVFEESLARWADTVPQHAPHVSADYLLKEDNDLRDHLTFTDAEFARLKEIHAGASVGGELNMARFREGVMQFTWDDQQARLRLEMRVAATILGMKVYIIAPHHHNGMLQVHALEPSVTFELDDRLSKIRQMYFSNWEHTVSLKRSDDSQAVVLAWDGSRWCGVCPDEIDAELLAALQEDD